MAKIQGMMRGFYNLKTHLKLFGEAIKKKILVCIFSEKLVLENGKAANTKSEDQSRKSEVRSPTCMTARLYDCKTKKCQ